MYLNLFFDLFWNFTRGVQSTIRRLHFPLSLSSKTKLSNLSFELANSETLVAHEVFEFRDNSTDSVKFFSFESRKVLTCNDAIVDLQSGIILDKSKGIIAESSPWSIEHLIANKLPSKAFPKRLIPKYSEEENVLKLASLGYYHFLIEELPSLLHLLGFFPERKVLIADKSPKYLFDIISELGLPHAVVKSLVNVPSVTYLSYQPSTGWPHPRDIAILRETFEHLFIGKNSAGNKLYISRNKSSRSPKFETELERVLTEKGWQIVFAEDLDFREQVALFSSASIVMGIHGAGLANAVWMSPATTLIELKPEDRPPCYEKMAQVLNLRYSNLPLKSHIEAQQGQIPFEIWKLLDVL